MTVQRRLVAIAGAFALRGAAAPRRRPSREGAPRPSRSRPANAPKNDASQNATPGRPCPICGKPPSTAYVPFCSKRCADVDLHKWLGGVYAIPAEEPANPDDLPAFEEKD